MSNAPGGTESQRTRIEWKGSKGRIYRKYVRLGDEAHAYRTILEQTIVSYEKLLLKYAPDRKQEQKADLERLVQARKA